ncbi:MAG: SDR family NAD(P)-dependent oxidoreductase [Nitrospirota bacterium]
MPVALVSGASGALGRAIAVRLGGAGYRVGVHYHHNAPAADRTCRAIRRAGGRALAVEADLRDHAAVERLVAQILRQWGRLDLLVHSAGGLRDGLVLRMAPADWHAVIAAHLTGGFHLLQLAGRVMRRQRRGHIVTIGALAGGAGRAGQANYAAAKAGLAALTRSAAREWGPHRVQVNCVVPGVLAAGMSARINAAQRARLRRNQWLARSAPAGDVADWILTLSRTRGVSGQVFHLDSRPAG